MKKTNTTNATVNITVEEALHLFVEADDSFTTKRENRRKIDDKKESAKTPHSSCRRKGYHKYERDWKRSSRRANRRNNKAEINGFVNGAMNITALQKYAEDRVFLEGEHFRQEAYGSYVWFDKVCHTYNVRVLYEVYDPNISYNDIDVYNDIEEGEEWFTFTLENIIKLGLCD